MEKVGVLIISKCLSASAIIDAFRRSDTYLPEFYIAERQANPFNVEIAKEYRVIPDLAISEISKFVKRFSNTIAFGLCDNEDFVVKGGRDAVEKEAGVPMICVTKKYALERSKAAQRLLFDKICPEANLRYKIIDPSQYKGELNALEAFRAAVKNLGQLVIKPDAPARGAGVGVWGSDFLTLREAEQFFLNVYAKGSVVVEERIEGEESSFHAISDGQHYFPTPLTRDYKRALDGNRGKLTGGMGSYRESRERLGFLNDVEWSEVLRIEEKAFRRWKGRGSNPGLRGIVEYDALMHSKSGFKILERNSRGGNTESMNLWTTLEEDPADMCYRIIDGNLRNVRFRKLASVVTCLVPKQYGTANAAAGAGGHVDLGRAMVLEKKQGQHLRVFPMDVRLEGGIVVHGSSRCVAVAGIGIDTEGARSYSLRLAKLIRGELRHRDDIASKADMLRSFTHMEELRAAN